MNPLIPAVLLALLGIAIPPEGAAGVLVGDASPLLGEVAAGMWILKALLVVHGLLLVVGSRVAPSAASERPLLSDPEGPEREILPAGTAWILVAALTATALVLRLIQLDAGLWYDEVRAMVQYGGLSAGEIIGTYDSQNNHLLYTLLARGAVAAFGENDWAFRLPAVVFGAASVPALFWFGSMVVTRLEALLASALLAFSYHHVWFSQNARGYSALLFFTLLTSGLFLMMLRARRFRGWGLPALYGVTMALAMYTNVTAVLVAAAHGVVWLTLLLPRRERGMAAWAPAGAFLLAASLTLLLYAPVLPQLGRVLLAPTMEGVQTEWESPLWFFAEMARGLVRGLPGGWLSLGAAAAVACIGLVSFAGRSLPVLGVLVLPGAGMALLLVVMEHNLWPRLFFFSAGFAVLIAVRGIVQATALAPARVRPALLAGIAAVAIAGSAATVPRAWGPKQDFRGAVAFMEDALGPGDAAVVVDMSRIPFNSWLGEGWIPVSSEEELAEIEEMHQRTWVLYIFPTRLHAVQPGIADRLERDYTTAATFPGTVGDGSIIVKVRG